MKNLGIYRRLILGVITIFFAILAIIGGTYAWYTESVRANVEDLVLQVSGREAIVKIYLGQDSNRDGILDLGVDNLPIYTEIVNAIYFNYDENGGNLEPGNVFTFRIVVKNADDLMNIRITDIIEFNSNYNNSNEIKKAMLLNYINNYQEDLFDVSNLSLEDFMNINNGFFVKDLDTNPMMEYIFDFTLTFDGDVSGNEGQAGYLSIKKIRINFSKD